MCKHEWKKIYEYESESKLEIFDKLGYELSRMPYNGVDKTIITDYTCNKCGKLKRFKTVV